MAHVLDDPLPEVLYTPDLAAIVRYSRASTLMQPITEASWKDLKTHFDDKQFIDIMFVVGMDQVISRFHAAIQTEVDGVTLDELALPGPVAGGPRAVSRGPRSPQRTSGSASAQPASLAPPDGDVTCQPDHDLGGPRRSLCSLVGATTGPARRAARSPRRPSPRRWQRRRPGRAGGAGRPRWSGPGPSPDCRFPR